MDKNLENRISESEDVIKNELIKISDYVHENHPSDFYVIQQFNLYLADMFLSLSLADTNDEEMKQRIEFVVNSAVDKIQMARHMKNLLFSKKGKNFVNPTTNRLQ